MARAQRDNKVTICHSLWMGNHVHFLLVSKDGYDFTQFYGEIKKKLTDTLKSLMGRRFLSPWDGDVVVARILDKKAAIHQIAYLYANPSRANLINSIEEYPLYNSYNDFKSAPSTTTASTDHLEYWVPAAEVPTLPSKVLKHHKDVEFTDLLKKSGFKHTLTIHPNAWMECFGITDSKEVEKTNKDVFDQLRAMEEEHAATRLKERKGVLGAKNLRLQPFMKHHVPGESERRIFVISSIKELRISFIEEFKDLCELCKEYFFQSLKGISCEWPPGMFRPSYRLRASALDLDEECVVV